MYVKTQRKICDVLDEDFQQYNHVPRATNLKNMQSRWKVTSAMQKAIRRGHVDIAQRMATALVRGCPNYFWSRIAIIAMEDVMFANLDLVAETIYISSNKPFDKYPELELAGYITEKLAKSNKDRSASAVS